MSAGDLIPTDELLDMDMSLVPLQSYRMGASGNSVRGVFGPTRWKLRVTTAPFLSQAAARIWDAFIADRIHNGNTFTAWRLHRINPGSGFLGNPDGSIGITVDAPNSQVSLSGVGVYVAAKGDMISYRTDVNGYYLGMVMADAVAVSSNVTLTLSPRPLAAHASTPAVRRVQALGEFDLSTPLDPFEDYTNRQLSFEALQVLR